MSENMNPTPLDHADNSNELNTDATNEVAKNVSPAENILSEESANEIAETINEQNVNTEISSEIVEEKIPEMILENTIEESTSVVSEPELFHHDTPPEQISNEVIDPATFF